MVVLLFQARGRHGDVPIFAVRPTKNVHTKKKEGEERKTERKKERKKKKMVCVLSNVAADPVPPHPFSPDVILCG